MNARDPIILVAFVLCITMFLLKIRDAFNDEYSIALVGDDLKQYLESQFLKETQLSDMIEIGFKFDKRNEFNKLKQLGISVSNKSSDHPIYVDWDCSTVTDLEGKARRLARIQPGMTTDLFQEQVFSTINPKTTLKEAITAEDLLQRKKEAEKDSPLNLEYEISKPLIDLKPEKPSDGLKKRIDRFNRRLQDSDLEFFLELSCRFFGPGQSLGGTRINIPCKFVLKKYPWWVGLPWNPK
jgi:hypothetical protein